MTRGPVGEGRRVRTDYDHDLVADVNAVTQELVGEESTRRGDTRAEAEPARAECGSDLGFSAARDRRQ